MQSQAPRRSGSACWRPWAIFSPSRCTPLHSRPPLPGLRVLGHLAGQVLGRGVAWRPCRGSAVSSAGSPLACAGSSGRLSPRALPRASRRLFGRFGGLTMALPVPRDRPSRSAAVSTTRGSRFSVEATEHPEQEAPDRHEHTDRDASTAASRPQPSLQTFINRSFSLSHLNTRIPPIFRGSAVRAVKEASHKWAMSAAATRHRCRILAAGNGVATFPSPSARARTRLPRTMGNWRSQCNVSPWPKRPTKTPASTWTPIARRWPGCPG